MPRATTTHDYFVADPSGLSSYLERDGLALPESHFFRELVRNGFDAGATEIVVDSWTDPDDGAAKLRVSDNGDGMNETQLAHHIKTLMASGAGREGNYGVGARMATLARNPYGVTWASKVATRRQAWQVRASKGRDGYGLQLFETEGGTWEPIYGPDEDILAPMVVRAGHGTCVVLHGKKRGAVTGKGLPSAATYLSKRFWRFPPRTKVHVQLSNGQHPVLPTKVLAERDATATGTLELIGALPALLRWYVLPPPTERARTSGSGLVGRLALLHEDELFSPYDEDGLLTRFGVMTKTARSRVLLVIEPIDGVSMNTQRTALIRPYNKQLPWTDWALGFNQQMPRQIRELIVATTPSHKLDELVARHMPDWQKLLLAQRLMRPVSSPTGLTGRTEERVASGPENPEDGDQESPEDQPDQVETTEEEVSQERAQQVAEAEPEESSPPVKLRASGGGNIPLEEVEEWTLPTVQWVAAGEWSAGPAWITFSREANVIQLRDDMPAVRSRIQDVLNAHTGIEKSIATAAVRGAYEVEAATSVLTILNLRYLRGALRYTEEQVAAVLEPMNLTATLAGMQSIDAVVDINLRELQR